MLLGVFLRRMANVTTDVTRCHVVWETAQFVAFLHPSPWTPGATVLTQKVTSGRNSIFQLAEQDYVELLMGARTVGNLLCERLGVQRCALVSRPLPNQPAHVRILPLHGLETGWTPHLAEEEDFWPRDPGYSSSKSGPRWQDNDLERIRHKIRAKLPSPEASPSYAFFGEVSHSGLFSRIVRGEEQQWRVWEDDAHVAFLTPYPNTPGLTVLVPRRPLPSDIFSLAEDDYKALVLASYRAAQLLKDGLEAHAVGLIFEGYEIDYAHAKLIPLLQPPLESCGAASPEYRPLYPGYVTSVDGPAASTETLQEMQARITLQSQ